MEPKYPGGLLHRKQFFYGLKPYPAESWKTYEMPEGSCLSTHPDLDVTQVQHNDFQVTLLGFILDPEQPEDDNRQVVTRLCGSARSVTQLIELTESLSGRWVLFLHHPSGTVVLNDAGSLRSIFYHFDHDSHAWLASQPGLIAEVLGFSYSDEGISYMHSKRYQEKVETWWPGDASPYAEIKHLLPNHLLDLSAKQARRFWPVKPLEKHSLQEGVQLAGDLMRGTLASAHRRFPLAMSLSSGYDSRVVFSACKDFAQDLFVFSLMYRHLNENSDDIRIPREMTKAVGLEHHLIDCRNPMSQEFAQIYNQNVAGSKDDWGVIVEARYHQVPRDRIVLKGAISEIVRCRFWDVGVYPYRVTLRDLVKAVPLGDDPLVKHSLKTWMQDALPVEKLGYRLLDFLSWEIEIGNWMGMAPMFFDLAQEEFSPFSNRRFLNIMLGVDPRYRSYPEHIMERQIVAYLWPELAKFPYTPSRHVKHKRFYDGPFLNALRWGRYLVFEEHYDRLAE